MRNAARAIAGAALGLAAFGLAGPAHADILSLRAEAHGGGQAGAGFAGEVESDSFFAGATGATYGALVGAEIVFVDVWVQHDQYVGGDGLAGTFTKFMLGLDLEMDLGQPKPRDPRVRPSGDGPWYAELGVGLGFGVGTGQQVDPPLDNSEVTDKGFVVEGRVGAGYHLTSFLDLGLTVPVQAGFFTKSGDEIYANDVDNHYADVSAAALLTLRANIVVK